MEKKMENQMETVVSGGSGSCREDLPKQPQGRETD